ncbi:hypothetical protein CCZ01_08245 [Helicobacter monodelphidis]|uniref:hypothetical protein n=1 Tax=Helicobacter sp. 15-1451 TaxID=2004995 RepID=UPI000DCB90B0|nr:hypothetical protein [Helicobacter sp. 15-1451]RAX56838.1 hypothetical protein CCZ01_08245 [Helicobacter sp. 15-1451]
MKKFCHNAHLYVSIFFLPLALMYALTGALYIFDIKDDVGAKIETYQVRAIIAEGKEAEFMISFLQEKGLRVPNKTSLEKNKKGELSMGSIAYNVSLNSKGNQHEITTMQRSIWGNMVLLHKAKGEFYFNILAIGFSLAMIGLYISGIIMTVYLKNKRKNAIITFIFGLTISIILGYLSVT